MHSTALAFLCLFASPDAEKLLTELVRESGVAGAALVVLKGDAPAQISYAGVADNATKAPVGPRTVFQAASLSKQITAYAALQLAAAGKFDLDKPLIDYARGEIPTDGRSEKITARHVLSHSSGLPNWRNSRFPLKAHFEPGSAYSYSGEGYVWLSKALEKVTGQDFETLIQTVIFKPLDMGDSSFVGHGRFLGRLAAGHDLHGNSFPKTGATKANAAASLLTTPADYARFLHAVMRGVPAMYEPAVKVASKCAQCLSPGAEKVDLDLSWGLGWGLYHRAGRTDFFQWGDNGDTKAFVIGDRERKEAVAIFLNSEAGLGIVPELLKAVRGDAGPLDGWLSYPRYDAPATVQARTAERLLIAGDLQGAAAAYRAWLEAAPKDTHPRRMLELIESGTMPRKHAEGNKTFALEGYADAKKVTVAGSFNNFHRHQFELARTDGRWSIVLMMKPGRYAYKFVVDGKWIVDPANPESEDDDHGGRNSVTGVEPGL